MSRTVLQWALAASLLLVAGVRMGLADDDIDRKIQPGDTIVIEVFGEEKLTVTRRVQASGAITYPLLKQIHVAGQTTPEVATAITRKLGARYLRNPEVSVTVKEYRSRTVTVHGAVDIRTANGGSIELPSEEPMELLEAVAKAGGFSAKAGKNPKIELTRRTREGTKVFHYRFNDLRKETDPAKKVWLEPGDIIYVPEPFF